MQTIPVRTDWMKRTDRLDGQNEGPVGSGRTDGMGRDGTGQDGMGRANGEKLAEVFEKRMIFLFLYRHSQTKLMFVEYSIYYMCISSSLKIRRL